MFNKQGGESSSENLMGSRYIVIGAPMYKWKFKLIGFHLVASLLIVGLHVNKSCN